MEQSKTCNQILMQGRRNHKKNFTVKLAFSDIRLGKIQNSFSHSIVYMLNEPDYSFQQLSIIDVTEMPADIQTFNRQCS